MVSKTHYIELWVNDQLVELFSQDSLNLRINNVVYNPTKVASTSGEYSFSFRLPSTPKNDKIFDYANNLSKINKFRARYSAKVYADSVLIFEGSLVCRKFDNKEKAYECNLVNIKISTLDELFGEETLADMKWEVPYNVGETINAVNADSSSKYYFPFVSYGAFQKEGALPDGGDENTPLEDLIYTSKYQIDPTNMFTKSSFYPSLNVLETVRKCFENKGYTCSGDAFLDSTLSNIYTSTHLAEGQLCDFNAGNPKIGNFHITSSYRDVSGNDPTDGYNHQDLKFKYEYVGDEDINYGKFNFSEILYTNLFASNSHQSIVRLFDARENMFNSKEGYVQIPASGFYKITLSGTTELLEEQGNFSEDRWIRDPNWRDWGLHELSDPFKYNISHARSIYTTCPIEIQLVKNYDDNIELIKGPYNMTYVVGFDCLTNSNTYQYYEENTLYNNRMQRWSAYPHERLGTDYNSYNGFGINNHHFYITDTTKIADTNYNRSEDYGLVPIRFAETALNSNGVKMAYDPAVSDAFICGISTMGFADRRSYGDNEGLGGTIAYRKDGYSWSKMYTAKNDALYNIGLNNYDWHTQYNIIKEIDTSTQGWQRPSMIFTTSRNANMMPIANGTTLNEYINVTKATSNQKAKAEFKLGCIMYLEKDDILNLMLIKKCQWNHDDMTSYRVSAYVDLDIMAASPKDIATLRRERYAYGSPTQFPINLNLFNFTSKEVKVSDWLKQIADAFNLSYEFNGNSVDVMTNKPITVSDSVPTNIDDRVSSDEAETEYISYPREMSVRYKIDTEEHGFYKSVPPEFINLSDWKEHGDSGYSVIKLDDDSYNTEVQTKSLQFSYNWNDEFTWVDTTGSTPSVTGTCSIPVISKEEYMIDGYQDWESMKHRGYSLAQRFWFRNFAPETLSNNSAMTVTLIDDGHLSGSIVVSGYSVNVYAPLNSYQGVDLSYKDDSSILTNYFNVVPNLSSNYVYVECYLTPEEYLLLKGGSQVKFDDDVYLVSEISGYDPSGSNKTKLKLIKKS